MRKILSSEKLKGKNFKIKGIYEITYSIKNQQFYRSFIPTRVYLEADDATPKSEGVFDFYFKENAVDDKFLEEKGKYNVNGYLLFYNGLYSDNKRDFGCPIQLVIDQKKNAKLAEGLRRKFIFPDVTDCEYRQIGLKVEILDGAQIVELTMDMLNDEQRENVEFGLITLDEIKQEMGLNIYGDRVTDIVITGLARNYSKGAVDTVYKDNDFRPPHPKGDIQDDDDNDDDVLDEDLL